MLFDRGRINNVSVNVTHLHRPLRYSLNPYNICTLSSMHAGFHYYSRLGYVLVCSV